MSNDKYMLKSRHESQMEECSFEVVCVTGMMEVNYLRSKKHRTDEVRKTCASN